MTSPNTTLNFNIGVLGHIDSGKTSIAKALSTVASTASFDRNPQSRERGITLDLGFSSLTVDAPDHIKNGSLFTKLQFTLVDCPGHASLIRTIIGGAQIVDMIMLVVDITKGIQTQTAECLIIGGITCSKMVIVLNKIDLISEQKREATIEKMKKRLGKTLENTKFADCSIIAVAAKPGGIQEIDNIGIIELIETLKSSSYRPLRISDGPLLFSIDHCFLIKGQGTVMTGTMLSGSISIQDIIEIPSLGVTKKVKSIQMFKTSAISAIQGDRIGICVTQFDPKLLERGLVCKPGTLSSTNRIIVSARKISYFKGAINSKKGKFHITVGHETTMGTCTFFEFLGGVESSKDVYHSDANKYCDSNEFDFSKEYIYKDELPEENDEDKNASANDTHRSRKSIKDNHYHAVVDLDHSINCAKNFLMIASKLDTDIHVNTCRLAFHGPITSTLVGQEFISNLKVFKTKTREGTVERMVDVHNIICKNLFKKETKLDIFVGLKVKLSTGEVGMIEGMFGQSGKTKIRIPGALHETTSKLLAGKSKQGKKLNAKSLLDRMDMVNLNEQIEDQLEESIKVILEFKRYIFDSNKKIIQT